MKSGCVEAVKLILPEEMHPIGRCMPPGGGGGGGGSHTMTVFCGVCGGGVSPFCTRSPGGACTATLASSGWVAPQ